MSRQRIQTWGSRLAISLALLLIVLAVLSGWYSLGYTMRSGSRMSAVGIGNGLGAFIISDQGAQVSTGWSLERFDPLWRWWFSIVRTPRTSQMLIPLWAPALGLLVLGWWGRPKRFGHGRCAKCGYATPGLDATVCPECGTTITHA